MLGRSGHLFGVVFQVTPAQRDPGAAVPAGEYLAEDVGRGCLGLGRCAQFLYLVGLLERLNGAADGGEASHVDCLGARGRRVVER